jgi:enoyl-CoA hydratase/carnithine racemase
LVNRRLEDRVAVLTMQAAPHNLFDEALIDAVLGGLAWAVDDGARAIVLESGLRHFSAGADVKALTRGAESGGGTLQRSPVQLLRAFAATPVPIVASVHGVCVGGGFEVALACDLFLAAESAKIGSVEAMVGLHPLMGAIQRITQRAGAARAAEMVLLGRRYDAQTLERWNVINRAVPDEQLAEVTMTLAQELAHGPTVAHAATKRLIAKTVNEGIDAADDAMAELQKPIFLSEDFANAARSFVTEGPGFARFEGR